MYRILLSSTPLNNPPALSIAHVAACCNTGETYKERGIRALKRQFSPVAVVLVGNGVHRHGLEPAPADGEYERVARLQQAAKPAVALQAQLQEPTPLL